MCRQEGYWTPEDGGEGPSYHEPMEDSRGGSARTSDKGCVRGAASDFDNSGTVWQFHKQRASDDGGRNPRQPVGCRLGSDLVAGAAGAAFWDTCRGQVSREVTQVVAACCGVRVSEITLEAGALGVECGGLTRWGEADNGREGSAEEKTLAALWQAYAPTDIVFLTHAASHEGNSVVTVRWRTTYLCHQLQAMSPSPARTLCSSTLKGKGLVRADMLRRRRCHRGRRSGGWRRGHPGRGAPRERRCARRPTQAGALGLRFPSTIYPREEKRISA